jgi:hypothetical protein
MRIPKPISWRKIWSQLPRSSPTKIMSIPPKINLKLMR